MRLHLVDGTSETMVEDYHTILAELEAYGEGLADKPRITVLNKIDALDEEAAAIARKNLEKASGGPVLDMSGVAKIGVTEVLRALRAQMVVSPEARPEPPAAPVQLAEARPVAAFGEPRGAWAQG